MKILDRRRYSKDLPYDAEIAYLESSGTQWIDIKYKPQNGSTIYIEGLFGVLSNGSSRQFLFSDGNSSYTHYNEFANMKYGGFQAYVSHTIKKWLLYQANALFTSTGVIYKIIIDGSEYTSSANSYSSSIWGNLRLFRIDNTYRSNGAIIGRCKINVNDALVRDLIPVRVGQVGYMYDKVSKQLFGNAGTGDFILGPDKGKAVINIKTHSTGGSDASLDVITENKEPVNILYTKTPWNNRYIEIKYTVGSVGWQIFALTPCLYDGQVYNSGDLITNWEYKVIKDIIIIANI